MTMHGLPGRGAGNLDRIAYGPQHRVELLSPRPKFDLIRRQLKHAHTTWPAIDAVKESKRPAAIRLISPEDSRKKLESRPSPTWFSNRPAHPPYAADFSQNSARLLRISNVDSQLTDVADVIREI
jgi:hypothetical protein